MSRRITLLNEDHEWLVRTVDSMLRKAKREAAIWVDHLSIIERVKDALYTADSGVDELFPEGPEQTPSGRRQDPNKITPARPRKGRLTKDETDAITAVTKKAVAVVAAKKPRAKRGERLATLPKLCKDHPAYGGIRVPRTDCEGCWKAWGRNRTRGEIAKAKDAFAKKQS